MSKYVPRPETMVDFREMIGTILENILDDSPGQVLYQVDQYVQRCKDTTGQAYEFAPEQQVRLEKLRSEK